MNNLWKLILFTLLFVASGVSYATECNKSEPAKGHWKELMTLSNELAFSLCIKATEGSEALVSTEQPTDVTFELWKSQVLFSAKELDEVMSSNEEDKQFEELTNVFITDVEKTIASMLDSDSAGQAIGISSETSLPTIRAKQDSDPMNRGLLKVNTVTARNLGEKDIEVKDVHTGDVAERCKKKFSEAKGNHCISYVEGWSKAVSSYNNQLIKITPALMSLAALKYSKDWEDFYLLSRAQTFIDTMYTSYRYSDQLGGSAFVKAPDVQYFLLRPGIVMEYVREAAEGSQFKEALSFEWYGFNYWRKCPYLLDNACGMSLVSTYSDRANSDNHNVGLMFHYDNNLSFGIVRGVGDKKESGIFVTIDLLKAFESKKERVRGWKKAINAE